MAWELIAVLGLLFELAVILKISHTATKNVEQLDEYCRLTEFYRKKIKAMKEDNIRLRTVTSQQRAEQRELLRENACLKDKCGSLKAQLDSTENKLSVANRLIEQTVRWVDKGRSV